MARTDTQTRAPAEAPLTAPAAPPPNPLAEVLKHALVLVSAVTIVWQASGYVQSRSSQIDVLTSKMAQREQEYSELKASMNRLSDSMSQLSLAITELRVRQSLQPAAPEIRK